MSTPDPSLLELKLLGTAGRFKRLMSDGLSLEDAIAKLTSPESVDDYVARNKTALDKVTEYLTSPEYMAKYLAAEREADPELRAQKLADLKRENFATLDLEALHRTIRARNRQMKAEGLLPPDAPL